MTVSKTLYILLIEALFSIIYCLLKVVCLRCFVIIKCVLIYGYNSSRHKLGEIVVYMLCT